MVCCFVGRGVLSLEFHLELPFVVFVVEFVHGAFALVLFEVLVGGYLWSLFWSKRLWKVVLFLVCFHYGPLSFGFIRDVLCPLFCLLYCSPSLGEVVYLYILFLFINIVSSLKKIREITKFSMAF